MKGVRRVALIEGRIFRFLVERLIVRGIFFVMMRVGGMDGNGCR